MSEKYKVDVLAFGAHPDDIELASGGTVSKLTKEGHEVAIVDFTRGEMGTRGNKEKREQEAIKAAEIMKVKFRENLNLPDCNLAVSDESIYKTISVIRKYRPNIVIMNSPFERHPDHEGLASIVRNAMFKSGLRKYITEFEGQEQNPHRIRKMFCYMQSYDFPKEPSFYIDITDTFDMKMAAIKAYSSQVWVPGISDPEGPVTRLSRPEFIEELEARALYCGTKIGCRYAEAFYSIEPVGLSSISKLL